MIVAKSSESRALATRLFEYPRRSGLLATNGLGPQKFFFGSGGFTILELPTVGVFSASVRHGEVFETN